MGLLDHDKFFVFDFSSLSMCFQAIYHLFRDIIHLVLILEKV